MGWSLEHDLDLECARRGLAQIEGVNIKGVWAEKQELSLGENEMQALWGDDFGLSLFLFFVHFKEEL